MFLNIRLTGTLYFSQSISLVPFLLSLSYLHDYFSYFPLVLCFLFHLSNLYYFRSDNTESEEVYQVWWIEPFRFLPSPSTRWKSKMVRKEKKRWLLDQQRHLVPYFEIRNASIFFFHKVIFYAQIKQYIWKVFDKVNLQKYSEIIK